MKDAARGAVYEKISPNEAMKIIRSGEECIMLDVRSPEEYKSGHIEGAVSLPIENINNLSAVIIPNKDNFVIVYCRSGIRSEIAAEELIRLGYSYVYDMGGIVNWPYEIVT